MPRSRKNHVEFANFHCTAGDSKNLIDIGSEIALPAFMSDQKRTYGTAEYFFMKQALVDLDEEGPAIALEFVKDKTLESQQVLEKGNLIERDASLRDSPSALVVLILRSHRIVYLPKTIRAPTLHEFELTSQIFLRRERERFIREAFNAAGRKRGERARLQLEYPIPNVSVVALSSATSIDNFFSTLVRVKSLRFELFQTNAEYGPDEFFRAAEERRKALGAESAVVEQKGGPEGLDAKQARKEVQSATHQGTARVVVNGDRADEKGVKQDNDKMKLRVQADDITASTPRGAAAKMAEKLTEQVKRGVLAVPHVAKDAAKRWREKIEEFKKRP